jgi:hypothetical protein
MIIARRSNNGMEFILKILDASIGKGGILYILLAILLPSPHGVAGSENQT